MTNITEAGPIHTTAELARLAATWYDGFQPPDPGDRTAAVFGWKGRLKPGSNYGTPLASFGGRLRSLIFIIEELP